MHVDESLASVTRLFTLQPRIWIADALCRDDVRLARRSDPYLVYFDAITLGTITLGTITLGTITLGTITLGTITLVGGGVA